MGTAGGAGRLNDIDFSVDPIWEGEVRDGSRECEGDVKDDVRGRAVAGEVKEEDIYHQVKMFIDFDIHQRNTPITRPQVVRMRICVIDDTYSNQNRC